MSINTDAFKEILRLDGKSEAFLYLTERERLSSSEARRLIECELAGTSAFSILPIVEDPITYYCETCGELSENEKCVPCHQSFFKRMLTKWMS